LLFSLENLYRHYLQCRRNKRNTLNALRFEARQEEHLLALRDALVNHTYAPARSVCFVVQRPKLREIFAADFRDRIVHHVLVSALERVWEPIFIHDSYACRTGKGVHAGVDRLQQFIRQVTHNGTRRAWYLQLDIHNYFMSIDKDILFALLAPKIHDDDVLWLTRLLVFHDCTQDYLLKGDPELLARIPPHKTLFGTGPNRGLPIGNLNSQFFANVYLNGLDQFVKHQLKCRHYLRYCDDFVLLAPEREQLLDWREQIAAYLRENLRLELNPKRQRLRPVSDGVDFLGYIVRGDYRLVRRRVVNHLHERLRDYEKRLVVERPAYRRYRFDHALLDQLHATFASYLGHFQKADTYCLRQTVWSDYPFLAQYFDFDPERALLSRKYRPPGGFRRVADQYRYYRWHFPGDVLFFQVGRFCEFYHPQDADLARLLKLKRLKPNHRRALWGFPVEQTRRRFRFLLEQGKSVVWIGPTGRYLTGIEERLPVDRIESRFLAPAH
jgi:hypothetical protein